MSAADADALLHTIKQVAREEMGHVKHNTLGYVSAYDVDTHSVRLVVPSFRVRGPSGELEAYQTDWIPLGTPWAGDGFGDQVSPFAAAASPASPGAGEQVILQLIEEDNGFSVAGCFFFNTAYPPPGGIDPGERILKSQGGKSLKLGNDALVANEGSTPAAVEGSTVTHEHSLVALLTSLGSAIAALPTITPTALGAIFTAAAVPATVTDTAGSLAHGALTPAAVDSGAGAQDVLLPGPGDS
jgi:hypothetical protein